METVMAKPNPESAVAEPVVAESNGSAAPAVATPANEDLTPSQPAGVAALATRLSKIARSMLAPTLGIVGFLLLWAVCAPLVKTSLGTLPGPVAVAEQGVALYNDYVATNEAKAQFYADQDARNATVPEAQRRYFDYAGAPTFLDQIITSLETVAMGFIFATVVAVPLGLVCGLSKTVNAAINPLVQIFKPVSPLAWLPIVTMVISATMSGPDPILPKSFVISAIVVTLCSLWPTLINTAVGTASIDKDLLNVGKVLRLGWFAKLRRLVLPSALPYIFTGMRLSLGVGWMVLIAAEMLAQNPGLGKFVWDEFQNGSSQSLARIIFAVIVIGIIGFLLDRLMASLQSLASRNHAI